MKLSIAKIQYFDLSKCKVPGSAFNFLAGSYLLQMFVEKFGELHQLDDTSYHPGKQCFNVLYIVVTLYNLKVCIVSP